MAGNVHEWVNDWYSSDYYSVSPASNPPGPTTGTLKIFRGGSYYDDDFAIRTVLRGSFYPSSSFNNVGFRCAATP